MKWQKILLLFSPLFTFVLGLFVSSVNASAVSVSTSSFDLHYTPGGNVPYQWRNNIRYGDSYSTSIDADGGANIYQFTTEPIQAGGNSASIHFETNIVASWYYAANLDPWVNLQQQNVIICNSSPSSASTISRNLSTVTTLWGNRESNTLTLYGDVTVTGLTAGTTYQFVCAIGNDNYSFIDPPGNNSVAVWFEQNPMTISWFTDESQALAQTQINQNQTIINQNESIINQVEATNDWLTDTTPPSADTSSLSNAAGWLPPGPLDSILNLPVQFIQGIIGVFTNSNTCSPIVLPLDIIDYDLEIPCMRPFFELASVNIVWNTVGTIISAVLIFQTLKWLYKFVDDTLSFREGNSTMWGGL